MARNCKGAIVVSLSNVFVREESGSEGCKIGKVASLLRRNLGDIVPQRMFLILLLLFFDVDDFSISLSSTCMAYISRLTSSFRRKFTDRRLA